MQATTLVQVTVITVLTIPATEDRSDAATALAAATEGLGDDELRVLARIAERLRHGQAVYGRVNAATDRRDFKVEAREELEDFLVYDALRWLKDDARGSVH